MIGTIKYEVMIILTQKFNENELKTWSLNYAKALQNLRVSDISIISRGRRDLAYLIETQKKGNFIQINFSSMPKYVEQFIYDLKFDTNVLRFLILNKEN